MKCEWCGKEGGRKSHWSTKWETGKPRHFIMCEPCETELDEATTQDKIQKEVN